MFNACNSNNEATNLLTVFNNFSIGNFETSKLNPVNVNRPNSESSDKLNVHSAILGMLNLSGQSHHFPMQYPYNGGIVQSNYQINHSESLTDNEIRHGAPVSTLTPPGSPNEGNLVIASPVKTPCKSAIIGDCQQNFAVQSKLHSNPHGLNMAESTHLNEYSSASSSQHYPLASFLSAAECFDASAVSLALNAASGHHPHQMGKQRSRSEKRPIPHEHKDDRYFERRRRNNQAAKKSRDTRKYREDEIALRAALLEKENAILRAQLGTLREEAQSLRHLLLQKRQRMNLQMHLQQNQTMALG